MRDFYVSKLIHYGLNKELLESFSILGLYELYRVLVLKETDR